MKAQANSAKHSIFITKIFDKFITRYMAHMWPQLLRRACHPVAGGMAMRKKAAPESANWCRLL